MIIQKKFNIILVVFLLMFSLAGIFNNSYAQGSEDLKQKNSSEPLEASIKLSQSQMLDMFLIEVSLRKNLSLQKLREAFVDVTPQLTAKQYITPPVGSRAKKNWLKYRQNALDPIRIEAGQKFWLANQEELIRIENTTGVPAALIVGILGIETNYGKNMGRFPVRDVLVTLAFDYPDTPNRIARSQMFNEQLSDLITFCSPTGLIDNPIQFKTCLTQPSSFAGAIGMPQFMPTSLLKFAKDGDKDGLIDLRNSASDAMASIANFLLQHGWMVNQPILIPVKTGTETLDTIRRIADGDPNPKWTLSQLKTMKIIDKIPSSNQAEDLALIVDLPIIDTKGIESVTYWVGLKNFEVITQYNRSFFYAMAVTEFGYTVASNLNPEQKNPVNRETLNSVKQEKPQSTNNDHPGHKRQKRQ
jgi:membrane-bound lytic murein transglycosylase B